MNSARPSRPLRQLTVRAALLLLLIPLAVAACRLARIPGPLTTWDFSEDGQHILVGTHRWLQDEEGEADEGIDFRLLSLRTGQIHEFHAVRAELVDGKVLWVEREGSNSFHVKCFDLDSYQESSIGKFHFEKFKDPRFFEPSGLIATVNEQNELCVIDARTGHVASASLPPLSATQSHFWLTRWRGSPRRILVREVTNGRTKLREQMLLFSYSNGTLKELSEWKAQGSPQVADDKMVSLTFDDQLEFRRLEDGALIETRPLGEVLKVPAGAMVFLGSVKPPLAFISVRPNQQIIYDFEQNRVVLERFNPNQRFAGFGADAVVFLTQNLLDYTVDVVRLSDQRPLMQFHFPSTVFSNRLTSDGKQIVVLQHDESVDRYDVASGRHLRTWRSRAWELPTFVALLVGFSVWSWLWVRLGRRAAWHPLWDVGVVNGLIFAGLLMRVFLQGSLRDPGRPVYVYCESLATSWLLLAALWFVFGRPRWSIRILAPLVGLTAVMALAFFMFRGDRQSIAAVLGGAAGGTMLMTIMLWLARRWGSRLTDGRPSLDSSDAPDVLRRVHQFPLRDLFFVVSVVAALLAVIRFVPLPHVDIQGAGFVGLLVCTTSGSAVAGAWAALSPRRWFVRLAVLMLLVGCLGSMHSLLFPSLASWQAWHWYFRFTAVTASFSAVSLLIFRVRGWRLTRTLEFRL